VSGYVNAWLLGNWKLNVLMNWYKKDFMKYIAGLAVGIFLTSLVILLSLSSEKPEDIKGRICLILDDFGYSVNENVQQFMSLDPNITLAIMPGQKYSSQIGRLADSLGLEAIIHMPMEPFEQMLYPADDFLLTENLNAEEIKSRVIRAFDEIPSAVGMNNHQGSKATENLQTMKDLARILKEKDKYFIDSFTNPESRGFITMRRYGVKTELRQVFLDHIEDRVHISRQLDSLAVLSEEMSVAVGIGHVTKELTLQVLKERLPELHKKGYRIYRASDIVR